MIRTIEYTNGEVVSVEKGDVEQEPCGGETVPVPSETGDPGPMIPYAKQKCTVACFYDCIVEHVPWYYITVCGIGCANPYICAACFGMAGGICLGHCCSSK
jgi:hypothetical protein